MSKIVPFGVKARAAYGVQLETMSADQLVAEAARIERARQSIDLLLDQVADHRSHSTVIGSGTPLAMMLAACPDAELVELSKDANRVPITWLRRCLGVKQEQYTYMAEIVGHARLRLINTAGRQQLAADLLERRSILDAAIAALNEHEQVATRLGVPALATGRGLESIVNHAVSMAATNSRR